MKFKTFAFATAASLLISGAAMAQDATPPNNAPAAAAPAEPAAPYTLAFNFGAATDYVFRGISQTNNHVQGFAGVDLTVGQFYTGVWTSNVDFSPFGDSRSSNEIDVYGGWKPTFGALTLDIGGIYYGYVHNPGNTNYGEVYGKGTYAFGPLSVGASVYYSPQFPAKSGHAWYYEGNAAYTVDKWTISGAVGRQDIEKAADYTTWNLGVGYALTKNVSLDLRYWDTDAHDFGDVYDAKFVGTLKATF